MSYDITLTNSNTLTSILDGTVDTVSTDLTLVGRNYTGFGQYINENLVKLLENFANPTPPSNPLLGQIWFNSLESNIQVYTSTGWRSASGPIVSDTEPLNLSTGDLWIDSRQDQLYFYDGTNLILAGPVWGKTQGITGFKAENVFDKTGNPTAILVLYITNQIFAILSNTDFIPDPAIDGFGSIKKGFQTSSYFSSNFYTTVDNAITFNGLTSDQFMRLDADQVTTGLLSIHNNGGVTVGTSSIGSLYVPTTTTKIALKNNSNGSPLVLQTTDSSGNTNDIVYLDGNVNRVGILNNTPQTTLDINGTTKTVNLISTTTTTLANLQIATSTIDSGHASATITATGNIANINVSIGTKGNGNIILTNTPRITGLADPTAAQDASTKNYTDITSVNAVKAGPISLSIIDNGLETNINNKTILILNDVAPPANNADEKIAYVHISHIDFASTAITRYLKKFTIDGGVWTFTADLTSSV